MNFHFHYEFYFLHILSCLDPNHPRNSKYVHGRSVPPRQIFCQARPSQWRPHRWHSTVAAATFYSAKSSQGLGLRGLASCGGPADEWTQWHSYIWSGITTGDTGVPAVAPKLLDILTLSQQRGIAYTPKRCGLFGQLRRRGGIKVSHFRIMVSGGLNFHSSYTNSTSYESWHFQLNFETLVRSLRLIVWPQEVTELTEVEMKKK